MRYVVRKSIILIVGELWMGGKGTLEKTLSAYDVENAKGENGKLTRESVQRWLDCNAGDFQHVIDFFASIEDGKDTVEIPWATEEAEELYCGLNSD